ncbi:hypothetical protein D3C81_2168470 [compost metagenome]
MQLQIAGFLMGEVDAVWAPARAQQGGAQAKQRSDGKLVRLATGPGRFTDHLQTDDHHPCRLLKQDGHGIVE